MRRSSAMALRSSSKAPLRRDAGQRRLRWASVSAAAWPMRPDARSRAQHAKRRPPAGAARSFRVQVELGHASAVHAGFRASRRSSVNGNSRLRCGASMRLPMPSARRVAHAEEARQAPALGLVGVDREGVVVAPARMRDVVLAAAERALHPGVDQVEGQRRVHADRRVQRRRRAPGAVAHAGDELADACRSAAAAARGRCR